MANNHLAKDFRHLILGIQKVVKAQAAIQKASGQTILENSSILKLQNSLPQLVEQSIPKNPGDIVERASMVGHGMKQFARVAAQNLYQKNVGTEGGEQTSAKNNVPSDDDVLFINEEDLESLYVKSLGIEVLQQTEDGKKYEQDEKTTSSSSSSFENLNQQNPVETHSTSFTNFAKSSKSEQDAVILEALKAQLGESEKPVRNTSDVSRVTPGAKPLSKRKPLSQLGESSKERKVPATRIGRLVSYGGLAAGLGFGAISEITKRSLGFANSSDGSSALDSSPFLTEANAERIVDTLCRVRGAALKIGQILSIQDNSMINPQLQRVFERVRHSADFMPTWQMERMLVSELGQEWKTKMKDFEDKPFAAASIGQVHLAKLLDGRPIAIKIQYPGVAQGIESDIDNLVSVLNVWNILPEGVFIDSIITVAKRELSWEVDYLREAECAIKFRKLLEPYPDYYVPQVIEELTTKQVYTTELIEGIPVDKCESLDQETRDRISYLLLDLFFRELFQFRFMQTDPNWSNFLYNTETKQVGLLDFGASREYSKEFSDKYMMILKGAAEHNRELVLDYSRRIGFLTGYESKIMENAHVDTVMLLGEAFRIGDAAYDFGSQNLTTRIQQLVPVMVAERLCPPPEEVYSLHRKLSGMFLLCSKLKGRVRCRPIFERVWSDYEKSHT